VHPQKTEVACSPTTLSVKIAGISQTIPVLKKRSSQYKERRPILLRLLAPIIFGFTGVNSPNPIVIYFTGLFNSQEIFVARTVQNVSRIIFCSNITLYIFYPCLTNFQQPYSSRSIIYMNYCFSILRCNFQAVCARDCCSTNHYY
jgi:hypothetical protein